MADQLSVNIDLTRRQLVEGGVLLGLLTLAGCRSRGETDLPGPVGLEPGHPTPRPVPSSPTVYVPPTQPPNPVPTWGTTPVLARSEWTSVGVARPENIIPMGHVNRITIHHDGMNPFTSTDKRAAASRMEQVRRSHTERTARDGRKWADIGYHYVIDPAGRVWEGRSIKYQGAHVELQNEGNLGIMCMGNYEQQSPTPATRSTLDRFVAEQMRLYRVPINRVYTHRELKSTACPGRNLQAYMAQTRGINGTMRLALVDAGEPGLC